MTSSDRAATMILMPRGLAVIAMLFLVVQTAAGQAPGILHIKVVLVDADRKATPVPRHALLISDNPASAPPRRIVTSSNGTADVRLPPGNYTVESDVPVAFDGKGYEWTQTVDIVAGRDSVLELTADNAEVVPVSSAATSAAAALEADPSLLLAQWQDSVVELWTPTAHGSGFLIGGEGLVATQQRVMGGAASVEVQLTPGVKVAGRILVADPGRDVAVLWIDPKTAATVRPVPAGCAQAATPPIVDGQKIFAIEAPIRQQKRTTSGTVSRVAAQGIESDLVVSTGSAGGPVFIAGGSVVGLTALVDAVVGRRQGNARVVPIADVCEVVASAQKKMKDAEPPGGTHLPVEPPQPVPVDALKDAVQRRAGSLNPYQTSSSDFDISFLTPVLTYAGQSAGVRAPMDFSNWSEYVADIPPVLLIRATPKMVEGFWTKVARGAAQTQGVSVPPIKRLKSGFLRMRAFCGDTEITPIHPLKLERRVSESDAIYEGLYVFDPGAIGPACGSVKLVLYSEKEPEKGDTQVVDAKVVQQIWRDFELYRAPK